MPIRTISPSGLPCWIDLMSSNIDASAAFYRDLFGWTVENQGSDFGNYHVFSSNGHEVAGGMDKNDVPNSGDMPDVWSIYIAVDDAAAAVAAAEAAGGSVMFGPDEVPTKGYMAFVTDPAGAAIGIWQSLEHKGFEVVDEPNAPCWFELWTNDFKGSVQFYESVFRANTTNVGDSDEFRYTTVDNSTAGESEQAAGIMDASGFLPEGVPPHWSVYFNVEDAEAALAKAVELGATVIQPVEETPYGKLATLADPTGAIFRLKG